MVISSLRSFVLAEKHWSFFCHDLISSLVHLIATCRLMKWFFFSSNAKVGLLLSVFRCNQHRISLPDLCNSSFQIWGKSRKAFERRNAGVNGRIGLVLPGALSGLQHRERVSKETTLRWRTQTVLRTAKVAKSCGAENSSGMNYTENCLLGSQESHCAMQTGSACKAQAKNPGDL
jgi:hypothetical protein